MPTNTLKKSKAKLGGRLVFNLAVFGFLGQVAWSVENMYFNTFLFNSIGGTTRDISNMVALSAITAVVTTFLMGTLSDRLNRRKVFLSAGYIAWGLTLMVFAWISRENVASLLGLTEDAKIVSATVSIVIIMDCVMTFMGSTSNDAAFNAWVTDVTVPENRGKTEGVLALFPILATVVVMVGFGVLVTEVGYPACFLGLGALVTLGGIIGIFSLKDSRSGEKKKGNYFAELVYGFRPSVIKQNARLYWTLLAVGISATALQVIMPYIFIYIQHYIGIDMNDIGGSLAITPGLIAVAVLALALVFAGAVGVGSLMDKVGKHIFVFPCAAVMVVSYAAACYVRNLLLFAVCAVVMLVSSSVLGMVLNATVRDFTPKEKAGQFQGVRMVFQVMLPMVIGPNLGNAVIERFAASHAAGTYTNDYGELVNVPVPEIYLAAALVAVLIFVPLVFAYRYIKQQHKQQVSAAA